MRVLFWIVTGILVVSLVAIGGTYGALQTNTGRDYLSAQVEALTRGTDNHVRISGLQGHVPFDFAADEISVADGDGVWLTVRGLVLDWSPQYLVGRVFRAERFAVEEIALDRAPRLSAAQSSADSDADAGMAIPLGIDIQSIQLTRVVVGAALAGRDVVFAVDGEAAIDLPAQQLHVAMKLDRLDGVPGRARINGTFATVTETLTLDISIDEAAGGLLGALAGMPDLPAVTMALAGNGRLDDWQATLDARVQGLAAVTGQARLAAMPGGRQAEATLDADVAGLLPANLRHLLRDGVHVVASSQLIDRGPIDIDLLRLETTAGAATLSGTVDIEAQRVDMSVQADVGDLAVAAPLIGQDIAGRAILEADLHGPWMSTVAEFRARADDLVLTDAAVGTITLDGVVRPDGGDWGAAGTEIAVSADGHLDDVMVAGAETVLAALGNDVGLAAEARVNQHTQLVLVDSATVQTATMVLSSAGRVELMDGRMRFAVRGEVPDLVPFAPLAGTALAGGIGLDAEIEFGQAMPAVIAFSVDGKEMRSGVPFADALIGTAPMVAGVAEIDPGGAVTVREARLQGASVSADVAGTLGADGHVDAMVQAALPELAALSDATGMGVAGSFDVSAALSGTVAAPAAVVDFGLRDAVVDQSPPLSATGRIHAADLTGAINGRAAINVGLMDTETTAAFDYAMVEEAVLIDDITVDATALRIGGDLSVPLNGGAAIGALTGQVTDLSPWGALAGVDAGGHVRFDLALRADAGGQGFQLAANGESLVMADNPVSLAAVAVNVTGRPDQFEFDVDLDGNHDRPISLQSAGNVARTSDGGQQLRLARLDGRYGDIPVQLAETAVIDFLGGAVSVENFAATVATGTVRARGRYGEERIVLNAALAQLPVALVAPDIAGTVDVQIDADLTAGSPRLDGRAELVGLRVQDDSIGPLPGIDIGADLTWQGQSAAVDIAATGVPGATISAGFSLPLGTDGVSPLPQWSSSGELKGHVSVDAALEKLAFLIPDENSVVRGALAVQADITGNIAEPEVRGTTALSGGYYENVATGTIVDDIELRIQGDDRRITIVELTANDGGDGRINGHGHIDLDAATDFPVSFDVEFDRFEALRSDDATAAASGALAVRGPTTALALTGGVTVGPAEIRIPDSAPAGVTTLDVIEVNGQEGAGDDIAQREPKRESPIALDIDINMPGRVFVRGRGLTSEWRGQLSVTGTSDAPLVLGTLQVVRGQFELIGRLLDLERGVITFDQAAVNDPGLDIRAVGDADDIIAVILVSGRASAPVLELTSEPPLPSDEVLARVLYGKSVGNLSPIQALGVARGLATLTGVGSGPGFLDKVRGVTGLDTLDVQSGGESVDEGRLRAGKYIADGVLLSVEQGLAQGSTRATLEVDITPNISVETNVGADAQTGIGVNVKTDY